MVFFIAPFAYAQVEITEVMYDLEGSDSGREWVEVVTTGDIADFSLWKFFEANTKHGLTLIQGDSNISSGGYAIISDNPDKFFVDNPSFSGTLFDSSFSLKQSGEYIAIKDSEGNEFSWLTYDVSLGASGDGNSLQKINGVWGTGLPTPGSANAFSSPVANGEENTDGSSTSSQANSSSGSSGSSSKVVEETISANAGEARRTVLVGGQTLFTGEGFGIKGVFLDKARYSWSFGDGSREDGQKVFHTYKVPGEYVVVLNVSSGKLSASDRVRVTAIPADFVLSFVGSGTDSFIEMKNGTARELNLSGWSLQSNGVVFYIPQDTFILSKGTISFPYEYTNIFPNKVSGVALNYPNGSVAVSSESQKTNYVAPVSVKTKAKTTQTPTKKLVQVENSPTSNLIKAEDVIEEESIAGQGAIVIGGLKGEGRDIPLYMWIMGLIAIIAIGIAGVLLSKSTRPQAQEYKIVEVEEIDSNT